MTFYAVYHQIRNTLFERHFKSADDHEIQYFNDALVVSLVDEPVFDYDGSSEIWGDYNYYEYDNGDENDWPEESYCQKNDFEVEIQVAKEDFSGTDNHVEIIVYFFDANQNLIPVTRWQQLNTRWVDDFERLSRRKYCVPVALSWTRFDWG